MYSENGRFYDFKSELHDGKVYSFNISYITSTLMTCVISSVMNGLLLCSLMVNWEFVVTKS